MKEAEQFAEEDKKRKEKVDNKNKLDGMIFSVEQTMKDSGDKLTDDDKATLNGAIETAKKELESDDDERIKAAYDHSDEHRAAGIPEAVSERSGRGGCQPRYGRRERRKRRRYGIPSVSRKIKNAGICPCANEITKHRVRRKGEPEWRIIKK